MSEPELNLAIDDRVAVVSLPGAGYTRSNLTALAETIGALDEREDIAAIVLEGSAGTFWIGASAALLEHMCTCEHDAVVSIVERGQRNIRALLRSPKLIVAHLNGFAAGGGVDVLLACDLAYATAETRVNLFYAKLGLLPDQGALFLLADRLGWHAALRSAEACPTWKASELQALGLIKEQLPDDGTARVWSRILRKQLRISTAARAELKRARWRALEQPFEQHLADVRLRMAGLLARPEQKALVSRMQAMQQLRGSDLD